MNCDLRCSDIRTGLVYGRDCETCEGKGTIPFVSLRTRRTTSTPSPRVLGLATVGSRAIVATADGVFELIERDGKIVLDRISFSMEAER